MRKINLEQMIRNIVQDELEKSFSVSSSDEEFTNAEESSDVDEAETITLPTLERAPIQSRGKPKNRGRGRVTKSTDGRLRANKK